MDRDGAVEQLLLESKRRADDQQRTEGLARLRNALQSHATRVEQSVLVEEILVRVRREAELGKHGYGRARFVSPLRQGNGSCRVISRATEPHQRDADGNPGKTMPIDRVEWRAAHVTR
jgi:hypothetical protein